MCEQTAQELYTVLRLFDQPVLLKKLTAMSYTQLSYSI